MEPLSEFELRGLIGQRVFSQTPGLHGILEAVREDGFLLVTTPFGTAYLHPTSLMPPPRFPPVCRVSTQFGRGRVIRSMHRERVGVVYEVELMDCRLANATNATGYFAAPSVKCAASAGELRVFKALEELEALRLVGNTAFNAQDFDAAISAYEQGASVLTTCTGAARGEDGSPPVLDIALRSTMREALIKVFSNLSMAFNKKGDVDSLKQAVYYTSQALDIDPNDITGYKSKLLHRRATAYKGLNCLDEAMEDLKSPLLASEAASQSLLKEVRQMLKASKSVEQKVWSGAFSKAAAGEGGGVEGDSGSSSGSGSGGGGGGSTPSSPRKSLSKEMEGGAGAKRPLESSRVGSETLEEEVDEEEVEGNSLWSSWLPLGAAVLGAAAIGGFMYMRHARK